MVLIALAFGGCVALAGGLLWRSPWHVRSTGRGPASLPEAKQTGLAHGFAATAIDVDTFARGVLDALAPSARDHGVGLRMAVAPGLAVRCDIDVLHDALRDLIVAGMGHAGTTAILLSAYRHGGRVEIAVTDDGDGPDAETQISLLRQAEQALALHGATIEVDALPQGSMVRLRLPESPAQPVTAPPVAAAAPASPARLAGDARQFSPVASA